MQQVPDTLHDVQKIKESLTKPQDLNKIINIVAYRSNSQRQLIANNYYEKYKVKLIDDLNKELSGNFRKAVVALFYSPVDYDCYQLKKSIKGLGTDESTLIEILATRSNKRIAEIKKRYSEIFDGTDIRKEIKSKTSGYFEKILQKILEGARPDIPNPDEKSCEESAKQLINAENANKELKQDIFMNIFLQKSREEFILITKNYYKLSGKTILETVEKSFSGDVKKVYKTIAYSLLSPSEYFANRINKAIKRFMTKDNILIRVLVSRDEIDLERIKKYYKQIYKIDLYTEVANDLSGDYRNLLLSLIGK